jgi:peptidyl-dipeptidase A
MFRPNRATRVHRVLSFLLGGALLLGIPASARAQAAAEIQRDAQSFLELYNRLYQSLYTVATEASWKAGTDVTPEHTGLRIGADHAFSAFVGNPFIIERTRHFLRHTNALDALTVRQLRTAYLDASGAPGTLPEVVAARVAAEARQSATLDGFPFQWQRPGTDKLEPITANQIDDGLATSTNLSERLALWKASKESGIALKPGLLELRDLRNKVAREMGFSSFFGLRVGTFDMSVAEMQTLTDKLVNDTRPLYEQLHCWVRHKLANKYGQPVPKLIPAHWLGNRWSQAWPGLVDSINLDPLFKGRKPEWIVQQAVVYGESLGLPKVPASFWDKSDLYELPADAKRRKNTHASAWSINLAEDVRSLQNVRADFDWFSTAHHELGHVFYDLAYSRPEVPMVLRRGASPAFHEAMAETLATPTIQVPYLRQVGIVPDSMQFDEVQWLLNSALDQVVFIPWSAGVMRAWEQDFYEQDLPKDQLNRRWWQYVEKYQGVSAPEPRTENYCDAATKTHINDDPAEYYKYSIAFALKYHLHLHIARKLLKQDPRNCNFYGNQEVGAFLYNIMKSGATKDWREVIREATGEDLSAKAMLEYYQPVLDYLKKENAGRQVGW